MKLLVYSEQQLDCLHKRSWIWCAQWESSCEAQAHIHEVTGGASIMQLIRGSAVAAPVL